MDGRIDFSLAERIVGERAQTEGALLPVLHAMHAAFGHIPAELVALIAERLNLSRADVHGVISFYRDFQPAARGRLVVKLCRAEACQAMGAAEAAEHLLQRLAIAWDTATSDGAISVEPVFCLGLCAVAPGALIGDEPFGRFDGPALLAAVEQRR